MTKITKGKYIIMGKYIMKKYKERFAIERKYVKRNMLLFDIITVNGKDCFYVKDAFSCLDRETYLSGDYSHIGDFNGELDLVYGLPCIGFMDELFEYKKVPHNNLTKSEWREVIKVIQMLYNENYIFYERAGYFLTKYGFVCICGGKLELEIVNCHDEGGLAEFYEYLCFKSTPAPRL